MTRTLLTLLAAVAVMAPFAEARAQGAPTLSISAPTEKVVNPTNMVVSLQYNLTGGTYSPAEIVFVTPPGALLIGSSYNSATFTHSESPAGTHRWRTSPSFVVDNVGTAGAISLDIDLPTWSTLDGTVFTWDAHIAGSYTPTNGSSSTLDVAATSRTTTARAAPLTLGHWNAGLWLNKWVNHPTLGPGALITYDLRPYVDGWQPLAEGWTLEITLGSGLYYVQAFSDRGNNGWPPGDDSLVIDAQPAPGASGGTIHAYKPAGATLGANDLRQVSNSDYQYAHSSHLYVEAFVPCAQIPLTTAQYNSPAFAVSMRSTGQFRTSTGLSPLRTAETNDIRTSNFTTGLGCFTGGGLDKYYDGERGEGRWDDFVISLVPPKGAQPIEGMVVDLLPAGFTDVGYRGVNASFTAYYCVLPSITTFTLDTFLSTYRNNQCTTTKPAIPTTTTHVVFYAAAWGGGTAGIGEISFIVDLYVPDGYVPTGQTSRPFTNTAWFNGRTNLDADVELEVLGDTDIGTNRSSGDLFQDSTLHQIIAVSYPLPQDQTNYVANPVLVAPGQFRRVAFRYYINGAYSPALNPVVSIAVPNGVVIAAPDGGDPITTTVQSGGGCNPAPGEAHIDVPDPTARPLVWRFGDDVEPYRQTYYCMRTEFWAWVDPTYPWVDLSTLDFVASIDAENEAPTAPSSLVTARFQVSVPPEVQVEVKPACQQARDAGGEFPPAFVVATRNTSGAALANVSTTLRLPRADVDGGTGDGTFVGVEMIGAMPPGATFEVSSDGTNWGPPSGPDVTVTHVRLAGFALAPYAAPVAYRVSLATTATAGAMLIGRAQLTSQQIAFGDSGPSEPFIAGSCHQLTVNKFYDANSSGTYDGGDAALSGWDFAIANDGVVIAAGETDGAGNYHVVVPAATYTVTEDLPATSGNAPVWAPTTPVGAPSVSQVVVVADEDITLAFGNSCNCNDQDGDLCTYSACLVSNNRVLTADDASCSADDRPTCVAANACGSAACEPSTGECTYDGPDCTEVDHFIPVTNAAGQVVGNVHCVLRAGQAPDCEMEGGRLKVIALGAQGSNVCGPGD